MPNRIIAGRYELLKIVGRGGMSVVYLAADLTLNKNWAVKEIRKHGTIGGQSIQNSLLAEAEMMKNLEHPYLPRIIDIIEEGDCFYIVMDYVEGENLRKILDAYGPQDQTQVIEWGKQLAIVLDYLHSQDPPIIYRDMKPGNIILQPNGTIKLIDFGIARTYKAGKSKDTSPLGTQGYAAPEQYDDGSGNSSQTDVRTDIYNLGVTMYELVTGKMPSKAPYRVQPIREVDPSLSIGLERIIDICTRPSPDERFQSARELMSALMNYEKLDYSYTKGLKRKIRRAVLPAAAGLICLILGAGLFTTDRIMTANRYENLIAETGNPQTHMSNLEKAIEVDPQRSEAYKLLIKEYARTRTLGGEGADEVYEICAKGLVKVDPDSREYLEINYMLGESYLVYYTGETDDSMRNRIMTARPYFDAVVASGDEEYENYGLSKAYADLAGFYEEYVINDTSSFVFDAGKKEYKKFLESCNAAIDNLDAGKSNTIPQLKVSTYNIILGVIDSEKSNMAGCIPEKDVQKVISKIQKSTESINTTNMTLSEQKEVLLKFAGQEEKLVSESYKQSSRGKGGEK